jgi:hypothetical protein
MHLFGGSISGGELSKRTRSSIAAAICGAILLSGSSSAATDVPTSQAMGQIFEAVQTLLLTALDGDKWSDPANAAEIEAAILTLEQMGSELQSHEGDGTASFAFFSRTLSLSTTNLASKHRAGDLEFAREQLFALVHSCVGCHSRLPATADSDLSKRFVSDARMAELTLEERATFETATRQFDAALATYETIFRSPDYTPVDLSRMGLLDNYLALCLQVRGDAERPRRTLELLLERPDQDAALAADLRNWLKDLERVHAEKSEMDLDAIRERIARSEAASVSRSERNLLVDYLASAAQLHRYVEDSAHSSLEHAEAYSLLGLVESRVGRVFWPAPEEFYLQVAIRMAPGTQVARDAFELYEEIATIGYTGSGGTRMPANMVSHLEYLRELALDPPPGVPGTKSSPSKPRDGEK